MPAVLWLFTDDYLGEGHGGGGTFLSADPLKVVLQNRGFSDIPWTWTSSFTGNLGVNSTYLYVLFAVLIKGARYKVSVSTEVTRIEKRTKRELCCVLSDNQAAPGATFSLTTALY